MMNRERRVRHYKPGQTVAYDGEEARGLFWLESGLIRVTKLTKSGELMTVRHVLPGDYFGEESFTTHCFAAKPWRLVRQRCVPSTPTRCRRMNGWRSA